MLNTNQHLEKLATIYSDFVACSMLPARNTPGRNVWLILGPCQAGINDIGAEDDDEGPVEKENIDRHVSLACTCGKSISLSEYTSLTFSRMQLSMGYGKPILSFLSITTTRLRVVALLHLYPHVFTCRPLCVQHSQPVQAILVPFERLAYLSHCYCQMD